MNNEIKMVALDLDGTLLNSKKEVTEYTGKVLEEAVDEGTAVVISTGRPLSGLPDNVLSLKGIRYAVTANGARIYDLKDNAILYEKLVEFEAAERILKIFSEFDALIEIYFGGQGYADGEKLEHISRYLPDRYMAEYIAATRKPVDHVEELFYKEKASVDKVQAIFSSMEEKNEALRRLQADPALGDLEITGALKNNLEINAAGVNKGNGLLALGKVLGIGREEIMACGDGNNDVAMMQAVGLAVAMKNSCQEILDLADYVTESNDDDGVAKAVEKFVLGK